MEEMWRCHDAGRPYRKILAITNPRVRRWLGLAPGEGRWHEVSVRRTSCYIPVSLVVYCLQDAFPAALALIDVLLLFP